MAIAFDAATSAATAQGTSANISHTCSGSDRLLIVTVGTDGRAQSVTSATYNGVALTRAIRRQHTNTDAFAGFEELWYLVNPATGTNTLVLNLSTSMQVQAVISSYTGVHQSTPLGTAVGADGVSTGPSVIVGSAGDELVVDGLGFYKDPAAASTLTPGAGQTRNGTQVSFANNFVHGSSSREAGAASVTMSWTSSQSDNWVLVAVPIKPAGAGTTILPRITAEGLYVGMAA